MGYILDLYQIIIPASPESLGLRIVILLAGNVCIAFGVYTMVQSHLVLAPVDGVILSFLIIIIRRIPCVGTVLILQ